MTTIPPKLAHLARLYGIQTSYRGVQRRKFDSSVESILAILQALGAPVQSVADIDSALAARFIELWARVVEPVVVAWDGKIPPISIRSPKATTGGTLRSTLTLATGEAQSSITPVSKLLIRNQQDLGGIKYIEQELNIGRPLPTGYHGLRIELDGKIHDTMIISAPMRAHFPFERKEWGVFAPVYALHSKRNPNVGDLTDFETLIDWIGVLGGRVAGTLPLLAAYMDEPFEPSPYSPVSRLFWNEFYVDTGAARRAGKSDTIDYRKEMAFRRGLLEKEADAFFKKDGAERTAFSAFLKAEKELAQYARFRAVTDKQRKGWREWPARLRDGDLRPSDYDARDERYHLYAQWRVQKELKRLAEKTRKTGQLLYLDLPVGLHGDAYDIWRFRDQFVCAASGGAPPDPVFTQGQNWSFPPMHPEIMRMNRHAYTIAYIRNHLRYARMLRIDHVMGLHRLFWIPNGCNGDQGAYVDYPADEIYAILSVESHKSQAGIVGENLGIVPPEVNIAMQRHNIQQMYVLQYEMADDDPKRALKQAPDGTVASLNTHDMPPFRGYLDGTDIDDHADLKFLDKKGATSEHLRRTAVRKALVQFLQSKRYLAAAGRPTPEGVFKASTEFLAASLTKVVVVNIEDLWGETLPQNVPSTSKQRPNWKRRMKLSLEEIGASVDAAETLRLVEKGRRLRR